MTAGEKATVLVVDDEERVTEAYRLWLEDDYDVETATSGEEALERLGEHVDVVLLDRQMPGLTGDEVLERIREEGYDCRVAMVTGIDPDFDIADLPFDDYVTKPADKEDVRGVVDDLLSVATFDEKSQELFSLSKKRAALESEKPAAELKRSEEYGELETRADRVRSELDDTIAEMDEEELEGLFHDV